MFILEFLPTWVFYAFTIVGMLLFGVSFFASKFPIIGEYGMAAQILAVVLLVFGLYFSGASNNQEIWESRVEKLNNKILALENEQYKINEVIVEKFIDRPIEVVTKHTETIIKKIPQIITKEIDSQCVIPKEAVDLHNEALTMPNDHTYRQPFVTSSSKITMSLESQI